MPLDKPTAPDTTNSVTENESSQWALLKSKKFLPFFICQFLGACNDNIFKIAIVTMITFSGNFSDNSLLSPNDLTNISSILFILPFFIASAFAGQTADKTEKSGLIQKIKLYEICLMTLGATGFLLGNLPLLFLVLFGMGLQSTFFGPVKYSLLPQTLTTTQLVGGNAMVEMGTFIAILVGTIIGGICFSFSNPALLIICITLTVAIGGWLASLAIPKIPSEAPTLKTNYNVWRLTQQCLRFATQDRTVFLSILGVSWFWFFSLAYLAQFTRFTKIILLGNPAVSTVLMALLSIGISAGSLLCERLSNHKLEPGLVPIGAFGLSVLGLCLGLIDYEAAAVAIANTAETTNDFTHSTLIDNSAAQGIIPFLQSSIGWSVCSTILGLGIFGGIYIVPLYALIQERSPAKTRSRIIAANNIINALAMVISSITCILILSVLDCTIPQLFVIISVLNLLVAVYIFTKSPEFMMRCIAWILVRSLYRIKTHQLHNIPKEGPALLICNHVSYMDPIIIGSHVRRNVRFIMYKPIYNIPILQFIFKLSKAIPIDSKQKDPETYASAFKRVSQYLQNGEVVCIFPEGRITPDGQLCPFQAGTQKILGQNPVPVIPMALQGLWGSLFSREQQSTTFKWPKKLWHRIELKAATAIPPEEASSKRLLDEVTRLLK